MLQEDGCPPARSRNFRVQYGITLIGIAGLLSLFPWYVARRRRLAGTTLTVALDWLLAAFAAWLVAWVLTRLELISVGRGDLLWYAVSVLWLCPPIAVLGARRPTIRVWGWFVLLPLMLVFGWPALSDVVRGSLSEHWTLEEPVLAGYALVLVMGAGNYAFGLGWGPVAVYALAATLLMLPLVPFAGRFALSADDCRIAATLIVVGGVWIGSAVQRNRNSPKGTDDPWARFNRLWNDFRNCFGVVWSHRLRESFNETARNSGWPVVLLPTGLAPTNTPAGNARVNEGTIAEIEHTWRWMLRRFVDPEWIDTRLKP